MSTAAPRSARRRSLRRTLAALTVASLGLVACGGSDDEVATPGDAANTEVEEESGDDTGGSNAADDDAAGDSGSGGAAPSTVETAPVAVDGAVLPVLEPGGDDPAIGTAAPVLDGVSFAGTPITVGGPTDSVTLVVFLAHWCPHCNDEIPEINELVADGRIPAGVDIVGVSTAAAADRDNFPPSQWVQDKGWTFPTMADSDELTAIDAWGGSSFPFAVVIDTDGTVLARRAGQASADETVAFLNDALSRSSA